MPCNYEVLETAFAFYFNFIFFLLDITQQNPTNCPEEPLYVYKNESMLFKPKKSPQKEASSYNVNIVNCVLICLETNLINVLGMPIVNCFLSLLQRCKGVDLTWAQIKEQSIFGIN